MDDPVHRPVPDPPAGWFRVLSTARLSGPSITTYRSRPKVPELNSTIYEMASNIADRRELLEAVEFLTTVSYPASIRIPN
jgi:hypothetical protein